MENSTVHQAWIGLGANLGDRKFYLGRAREELAKEAGTIQSVSGIYVSEPWGYQSSNPFYNQCLVMETALLPSVLLQELKKIERQLGRKVHGEGYADRVIDLDIIFYNNQVVSEENLEVPHPRIGERKFVLQPLMEISPRKTHPVTGQTITQMLGKCKDRGDVHRLVPE